MTVWTSIEGRREYFRNWRSNNKDKVRQHRIDNHDNYIDNRRHLRMEVLLSYGGQCACCGESRYEFLSMDHINGGGNAHRKELGSSEMVYRWLRANDYPAGFQVLCHNCNMARSFYGYCPCQNKD